MGMNVTKAVILAGGRGTRARIKSRFVDVVKVMLPIDRKPNLQRNIEILRDQLNVTSILIIVGHGEEEVRGHFRDGRQLGVEIEYVRGDPGHGIADALFAARDKVSGAFYVLLGDEFYLDFNHATLKQTKHQGADALVTFIRKHSPQEIARNYSLNLASDMRVVELCEKPPKVENDLLGLGTFLLTDAVFDYIEKTPVHPVTRRKELVDVISNMAKERQVYAHELRGIYVNINTIDDWHFAQFLANQAGFPSMRKSLVIPTFNEADSISFVINDFKNSVHEIVVVDGGSTDGTLEKLAELKDRFNLKLVQGKFHGYGDAIINGVAAASGDIVTIVEGDATFRSRDMDKLYEYLKDCDMVIGTRTTRQLICQGANMPFWLRIANVTAAKFIELLWISKEPRFTDVGCTYRTFWKSSYEEIKHNLLGAGPELSPEMMIEFVRNDMRVIEIPVSYYARIGGSSKHSFGVWGVSRTALRMLVMVLKKKFGIS
jgi:UDP-N-acetylglucosamine diphosphorylase / glucose-1-phosphate thymidylyltransferase / UDP-N-acetylgalactosamine diphosphorylase / glucosamine-1-phosphate N-acetyltransferase / galactosamine-1-phosphate N-acetyltransferase